MLTKLIGLGVVAVLAGACAPTWVGSDGQTATRGVEYQCEQEAAQFAPGFSDVAAFYRVSRFNECMQLKGYRAKR
jgi:hypothetical protein